MSGKGNAARHGGINGDLLILVEEEPHPELIRDENDILYNLLLSVPQAALGGTVEVPTIDGKAKVKIEPGTQPGKVLRLRNKGLPSVNSYGTGDLLVNVSPRLFTISRSWSWYLMSRWLVGSSRIRQSVFCARALARMIRCCSPPDKLEKTRCR